MSKIINTSPERTILQYMKTEPTQWWHTAVVYQIYPRSFQDTTGNGVGDLQGIIERLDHLEWLGVNTLWLSPVFLSPHKDMGYDISDYCQIDPLFGTLEDMDRLLESAHLRGMKVIMDGVFNHTSDQHVWFKDCLHGNNDRSDWYVWSTKPNNWQSAFGGSAWTYSKERDAYYLHTFASSQPDLNWSNPEVLNAILAVQRFWYERGVDGFRLDVFNAYCKDPLFRNNPRRHDLIGWIGGIFYGYIRHEHIFDRDRPELFGVLRSFRTLADQYNAVLIGETLDERFQYLRAREYVGPEKLHCAFDFSVLHSSWNNLPQAIQKLTQSVELPTLVWSNHDFPRQSKRWSNCPNRSKIMTLVQMTLPGVPVVYYGEEIDMPEGVLTRSEIVDPVGERWYPFFRGRDGSRLPMAWGGDGFTTGSSWLPDRSKSTVQSQGKEYDSPLLWMQRMITLRNEHPEWSVGNVEWVENGFVRHFEQYSIRVVINWHKHRLPIPQECRTGTMLAKIQDTSEISPYDGGIWKV